MFPLTWFVVIELQHRDKMPLLQSFPKATIFLSYTNIFTIHQLNRTCTLVTVRSSDTWASICSNSTTIVTGVYECVWKYEFNAFIVRMHESNVNRATLPKKYLKYKNVSAVHWMTFRNWAHYTLIHMYKHRNCVQIGFCIFSWIILVLID